MDTTASPVPATQPYAAVFDDVWFSPPPLPQVSVREGYQFSVIARNERNERELFTRVYITADSADRRSPQEQAAEWSRKTQADPKAQFKLLEQGVVSLPGVPPIRGQDNKSVREPYRLEFESYSVQEHSDSQASHGYENRYIQRFYFLPVSAEQTVVVRQVRQLKNDSPNSAFWKQWQHFLATLKVETATATSSIAGSGPRLRRYYTAHLSFEIPTGDDNTGNQWSYDHGAQRSAVWRTPQGDIGVEYGIISGYDFRVSAKNERLRELARGRVEGSPALLKALGEEEGETQMTYLEKKLGPHTAYGYRDEDGYNISLHLDLAYKTGKQITLTFSGLPAALKQHEPAIYAWLAQFKILQ